MLKQVLILSRMQLCNLFGMNEVRHTKDKAKKRNFLLLSVAYVLVILMAIFYVGGMIAGYHLLGIGDAAPMILYTVLSLVMLVLSFFKAGSVLFSMKFYDVSVSLPVNKSAILISRFITMYVTNLLLALLILLPGLAVHIYFAKPELSFYLINLPVLLFAPLLPLTLSSILGALMKAISSRMKRKSLAETLLTVLLVVAIFGGSFLFGEQAETLDGEALSQLLAMVTEQLGGIYPPALWYHEALHGNMLSLLLLLGLPALIFAVFMWLLSLRFQDICSGLNATYAKHDYQLKELKSEHMLTALIKREAKLYFSSSLYVTNTIIGYILAMILAVSVAVAGPENLLGMLSVSGTGEQIPVSADMLSIAVMLLPFVFSIPLCMMSLTACSISMEGKCFWQLQVLPVKAQEVYKSKILWNLLVAAPFYLISVVTLVIAAKPDILYALHYFLLPLSFLVFSVILGLCANLKFHRFNWDTEAQVIKQGAAVLISMLAGVVVVLLAMGIGMALLLGTGIRNLTLYCFAVEVVILLITAILYFSVTKKELLSLS